MRNGLKKVMALVLTLMMILSLVPATVFADTTDSNTVVVNGAATQDAGDGQETTQDGEEKDTYSIVINYVFADNSQAANPWTATIAKGSSYMKDITSPTVLGYTPNQAVVSINVTNIQQDVTYTVTYSPAEVNFTVKHYQQNVDNDQYTLVKTETKKGYTEKEVGANLAKTYVGFTALLYDTTTKIAADGSTEVEIYYDRNYYLLSLDLKGGYGADPVYARYGATISVDDPTKPGYTFGGWEPSKPDTMPAKDMTLTAQWNAGQATYLVQYLLENANDDDYSYDSSVQRSATVGSSVSGSGDKSYTGFKFDHADQNVTVNGDGTTVVNVYYKRILYEVKFYSKSRMYDRDEYKNLRITAKYGAYIGDKWPTYNESNTWNVDSDTYQSNIQTMPLNGAKFYGPLISSESETAYYYVEVLPGESGTEYNGVIYKEHHHDVSAGSGFTITDEDKYPIDGFTFKEVQAESSWSGKLLYADAKFYYTRNQYELVFDDQYGTKVTERLPFEQVLSESVHYKNNYQPAYPSTLEVGAYVFDGWYTDPGCTKPVDWNAKMPAASVVLYAYWAPVQHTVTFAKNEDEEPEHSENVAHGSTASGYTTTNGNYTFIGWFYKENGVEKAYTPSMQIRKDLELYAKWRSDAILPYTIYYKLEDGTVIATETTGSALAGATKTFDAKAGDQLNEGYRTGYFPQTNSHSLTMDINGNNEFTFIYVPKAEVNYTVRYLEKGTNAVLHEEKHESTRDAVVTEKFVTIKGYRPDAYQKRLVLSANENENVLTFWYEKDDTHAPVQIIHWTQHIAGNGYTEYQSSTDLDGVIGQTYTENPLTIPGYIYNTAKSNASGKLTAEGLVLNLYYDRIEYPYEFRFLEQGTDDNVLADPEKGSARYQAQVTQTAKVIPGYTLVSPENQAMNIAIEDPANVANKNVRIFYYTENTVNITYVAVQPAGAGNTLSSYADNNVKAVTGTVEGSIPQPAPTYKFVGWFKDEACTIPVDAAWVDANGKITPQKETLVEGQPAMGYKAAIYYAKFELNAVTVTVRKEVTGNFGDKSKYFKITYGSGENDAIRINHGHSLELPMEVLVNSTLTLTEECEGYAASAICKVGNDTIATASVVYAEAATKKNPTLTFDFSVEGKQLTGDAVIIITNHKDTTPDTGVLLDSLPYILIIACVAAIGAFIVIRRRKNRED
jgi:uncharacterized repeat protein (TIGR02543 family)